MDAAYAVAGAATFVWLGMVLGISFLEAPLKFRAPGVTLAIGLGIGRLVFRALNVCELVLGAALVGCMVTGDLATPAVAALVVAIVGLLAQVTLVRPGLTRRSDAVLAGSTGSRSRAHLAYVGLETAKALALLVGGIFLLV